MGEMRVSPVTLELDGGVARLEPLAEEHGPDLMEAAREESIWRWMPFPGPTTPELMRGYLGRAAAAQAAGREEPFAIVLKGERGARDTAIGSTRYMEIMPEHRALEIGATWIGGTWQRSAVNTECKYLLLRHAFEVLGAVRVQLKTDARNERSQRAIERIGAVREGVLRKSRILHDGFVRDTVYYSVIAGEWPGVKARLEGMMRRGGAGGAAQS
ncbi:MAG: GNAT family N-acetyltransferase [Phycisphaeraceae bacterium]|nr:GNAT family N-acetyltransferase [Phycisphaeraceae bacterium]